MATTHVLHELSTGDKKSTHDLEVIYYIVSQVGREQPLNRRCTALAEVVISIERNFKKHDQHDFLADAPQLR